MEGQNRLDNYVYQNRYYKPCHEYKTPFSFADFQRKDGILGWHSSTSPWCHIWKKTKQNKTVSWMINYVLNKQSLTNGKNANKDH